MCREESVHGDGSYSTAANSLTGTAWQYPASGGISYGLPFGNAGGGVIPHWCYGIRRRVVENSGGEKEVLIGEYDLSCTVSVTSSPLPENAALNYYTASALASASHYVENISNKGVILSSNLEPSYYKRQTDLPDNASGSGLKEMHKRKEDGSMEVDSVVYEEWSHSGSRIKLKSVAEMTANVYGITTPTSSQPQPVWESSGQINGGLYSHPPLELPYYRRFQQLDLSEDSLPGSTDIKFKITDTSIPKDFEAKYKINWHQPWEKGHRIKPDEPTHDNMVSHGWDAPRGNGLGADIQVHMQNPEIGFIEWYGQSGGQLIGALGGPAGGGAAAVYAIRGGASASTGFVWGLVAEAALLVLDYQLNQGVAPRLPDVTMTGGKAELREAISIQRLLNKGITAGIDAPYLQRITPKEFAEDIETEEDFVAFYRGKQGSIFVDPSRHNTNWRVFLIGDAYDSHGYVGDRNMTIINPRTEFPVFQFTVGRGGR